MKEKFKQNKSFIIAILLINLFILILMALYYYSISQQEIKETISKMNNQTSTIESTESQNQKNISTKIEDNVTTYIKAMITMEEDNYHPIESVKKVKDITTENFYEDLYSQYASYEENKGGSGSTGGTSTSVNVKEIYSKEVDTDNYDVIAFAEEIDVTDNVSSSTALLFKFNIKIENGNPLINEIITQQNFNYGIQGIVDKKI